MIFATLTKIVREWSRYTRREEERPLDRAADWLEREAAKTERGS